jgi:antitoxin YefM
MIMPMAVPAVPVSSKGRRPVRSSSRIAMIVMPTFTAPMPTFASSALADPADLTTIMVMSTQSLAAVKAHFSQVIDEVVGTHERVVVTKNGSPVAVILAVEDYEYLMETLQILSDPQAVAEIRDAQARMEQGETFGEDDIRATLAARRR